MMGDGNEVEYEKKLHEVSGVKYCWVCDDPKTKAMIESTQKLIKKLDLDCLQNRQKYRETIRKRYDLLMELSCIKYASGDFSGRQAQKTLLLNNLYEALHNLKSTDTSEQKLNIQMLHGTNNLAEEKKLLRKINKTQRREEEVPSYQLNGLVWNLYRRMEYYSKNKTRDEEIFNEMKEVEEGRKKAISTAASEGKIWDPLTSAKAIQDEIRVIRKLGEESRKENWEGREEINCIEEKFKEIEKIRSSLMKQSDDLCRKRDEAIQCILKLIEQRREAVCNCLHSFYV